MEVRTTPDPELVRGKSRIAQLEREAVAQSDDAAKVLRVHLDRYQALVLALAQVIWTQDPQGAMVGEQPSWGAYTGQTPSQYQGWGWLDAVHPDERAKTLALSVLAMTERVAWGCEHRLRGRNGEYCYFSLRSVPVFADDGSIREWAGIHTDISQRKLTEQSLRDGERQFRELADAMPQIIWGAQPNGVFDYYNRRWYAVTGQLDLENAAWSEAIHPDDRQESIDVWQQAVTSGQAYEVEYRLRWADGTYHWYLARALPVHNDSGVISRWFGTCTDIDERKRMEDQLRATTVMLRQSNRELEEFASVASHDLQEPLRKIRAFVECLRDEKAASLDGEGLLYLNRIQNAATRMTTLVADLLEFSRISSKARAFVPVDLNLIAAGVLSDLEATIAQTGGRVEVSELPTVASDAIQMRQLLQNLIGNGLKFHRPGVAPLVQVTAEIIHGRDAVNRVRPNGACRIAVTDNGIGFEEKYLDRVFTIFQRLHGRGKFEGTGIGLAICRRIVERHGGTITARSKPEQGSVFLVTLPLVQTIGAHFGKHG